MSSFIIDFTNTSGVKGTLVPDIGFSYTDKLSRINEASFKFSGLSASAKDLIDVGATVEVKRNGTLEFKGRVDSLNSLIGGGTVVKAFGFEIWFATENGAYASSPYSATASATIFGDIIGESTKFTAGTVEAGTSTDFRINVTDSLWNAISNLARKTQQDIGFDYVNDEIDILDHKGSATSVATLNNGLEITNLAVQQNFPTGNIIRVIGKSEGQTKVCACCVDSTSCTNFGAITHTIRDRTISTSTEAGLLGAAELAARKDPTKVYDFDMRRFDIGLVSGDVVTLNAHSQGLSNEDVRVVGVQRGIESEQEFMTLQVTNESFARLIKTRNEILGDIERNARQGEDYDQYEAEYSNQTVATCVGGIMCAGAAGGSTVILDAGCIFSADAINIGSSSPFNFLGANTVTGCGVVVTDLVAPVLGSDATTKTYVDACVGAGLGGLWVCESATTFQPCDGTVSIIPNCTAGGSNLNSVGTSTCPWDLIRGACVLGVSCVCSPLTCGTTSVNTPILNVTSCVAGSGALGNFCRINIGGSSACQLHVAGNGNFTGCVTAIFADTNCVCGSRRVRIPVGTNCF